MPRWLWALLTALLIMLAWSGIRSPQATPRDSGQAIACPLPDKFRNSNQPLQTTVDNRIQVIRVGDTSFIPLAGLSLQARVLARENYHFGTEAEFSPTDLALGWGPMAQPGMAETLNVSQSGRFYRYSWGEDGPPLSQSDIISNSANMHMVPANRIVAGSLDRVSANDLIELNGWLIRIEKNDGWRWQSSLTRDDSGDGACELVYVCGIEIKH